MFDHSTFIKRNELSIHNGREIILGGKLLKNDDNLHIANAYKE